MKIAIVAPCAVPYAVGGAEKLWWGLASHLNENTAHQAELIKLPSPEGDLPSLLASYEAFSKLDLSGFDTVISGKYPAWMVSHPRHVCYMLHRLRGLYDAYPGVTDLPPQFLEHEPLAALLAFMHRYEGARAALPEFFGRWNEVASAWNKPEGVLAFPGPLARLLVHWLDAIALAPGAIARYAAISHTVAARPGYFPPGADVAVAWPPPHRRMQPGEAARDRFYTVSRLDAPKRVALIVEAFRQVRTDLPLVIGGEGPQETSLRQLAAGDARIRFTGFESDAEVREHYRRAVAVPFVPYLEDYGLIAAEAMQCGTPVVTTRDSGGPCELVRDGVNGLVCDADAKSLAAAMQRLADDRTLAMRLGTAALEDGARIDWPTVERTLLDGLESRAAPAAAASPRRKLVVATTFAIYPPRHGGQSRVFHLYRALAPEFETTIVSVCPAEEPPFDEEIAPGLREVRVPMTREHQKREHAMQAKVGTPVTDVCMPRLHELTPAIRETLEREARGAAAVIACHPYLQPAIAGLGARLWYEAQDFELGLKRALLADVPGGAELVADTRAVEEATVREAGVILCASPDDADALVATYGVPRERIVPAPNGTDTSRIAFTPPRERAALKERLGFAATPTTFFLGSGHWPNIEAVKRIFALAGELPHVAFAVAGSVCAAFEQGSQPNNVLFLGEVDMITRNLCFQAFDAAVNPMEHGSGTNLKMLDFFSAGLPVVTTEQGSRGLRLEGEKYCLVRPLDRFAAAIEEMLGPGA
jgi:glycosyltransferase involved in cell wall biosynthesis